MATKKILWTVHHSAGRSLIPITLLLQNLKAPWMTHFVALSSHRPAPHHRHPIRRLRFPLPLPLPLFHVSPPISAPPPRFQSRPHPRGTCTSAALADCAEGCDHRVLGPYRCEASLASFWPCTVGSFCLFNCRGLSSHLHRFLLLQFSL